MNVLKDSGLNDLSTARHYGVKYRSLHYRILRVQLLLHGGLVFHWMLALLTRVAFEELEMK